MERNSAPLAFADKPDQEEWVAACTYSDQWVELENGRGFIRAWYICTHTKKGTVPPFCTLISSKRWRRKINTVLWAKGQAYYCLACDCKYNHNFGMLVQFMVPGFVPCSAFWLGVGISLASPEFTGPPFPDFLATSWPLAKLLWC